MSASDLRFWPGWNGAKLSRVCPCRSLHLGRRRLIGLGIGLGLSIREENAANAAAIEQRNRRNPSPRPQFYEIQGSGGVKALDIRPGAGRFPAPGDKVAIHYYGRLAAKQGWRFDSTYDHKDEAGNPQPFVFTIGSSNVIAGLDSALRTMKPGEIRRLIIPPSQGYQNTTQEPLPPNAKTLHNHLQSDKSSKRRKLYARNTGFRRRACENHGLEASDLIPYLGSKEKNFIWSFFFKPKNSLLKPFGSSLPKNQGTTLCTHLQARRPPPAAAPAAAATFFESMLTYFSLPSSNSQSDSELEEEDDELARLPPLRSKSTLHTTRFFPLITDGVDANAVICCKTNV